MTSSWKYGYAGPVDDVSGHPVGCGCWTCYLGRVRIGDGWVAMEPRAWVPPPADRDWLGPDAAGSTGL